MKASIYFAAALAAATACGLTGCAHRERTAPCAPLSYAATEIATAGPWSADRLDPCGAARPVNPEDGGAP